MTWDRKAYNREYMRQWRARQKVKAPKTNPHAACDAEIARLKAEIRRLTPKRKIAEREGPVDW